VKLDSLIDPNPHILRSLISKNLNILN